MIVHGFVPDGCEDDRYEPVLGHETDRFEVGYMVMDSKCSGLDGYEAMLRGCPGDGFELIDSNVIDSKYTELDGFELVEMMPI